MTKVDTNIDPQQIVCTGEEPGSDKWNPVFGTWVFDDFGIDSDEPVGQGERLYVKRSLYDQACAERDALKAENDRLREDAERWQALWSSERIRMIGSAGFDYSGPDQTVVSVREPSDSWLHFGLEVWDKHDACNKDYPQTRCRNLLLAYVDHQRAALKGGDA